MDELGTTPHTTTYPFINIFYSLYRVKTVRIVGKPIYIYIKGGHESLIYKKDWVPKFEHIWSQKIYVT